MFVQFGRAAPGAYRHDSIHVGASGHVLGTIEAANALCSLLGCLWSVVPFNAQRRFSVKCTGGVIVWVIYLACRMYITVRLCTPTLDQLAEKYEERMIPWEKYSVLEAVAFLWHIANHK